MPTSLTVLKWSVIAIAVAMFLNHSKPNQLKFLKYVSNFVQISNGFGTKWLPFFSKRNAFEN